jgi:hypothetical protein
VLLREQQVLSVLLQLLQRLNSPELAARVGDHAAANPRESHVRRGVNSSDELKASSATRVVLPSVTHACCRPLWVARSPSSRRGAP